MGNGNRCGNAPDRPRHPCRRIVPQRRQPRCRTGPCRQPRWTFPPRRDRPPTAHPNHSGKPRRRQPQPTLSTLAARRCSPNPRRVQNVRRPAHGAILACDLTGQRLPPLAGSSVFACCIPPAQLSERQGTPGGRVSPSPHFSTPDSQVQPTGRKQLGITLRTRSDNTPLRLIRLIGSLTLSL